MEKDIELKYSTYVDIYKHYSGLMFKARISIITIIFLAYGYILGIIPGKQEVIPDEIIKVLTPICAGTLMSAIFLLEVSYYNNFFRAIRALKELEKKVDDEKRCAFFSGYERRNWHFCILYLAASILFSAICIHYIIYYRQTLTQTKVNFAVAASMFPLFSLFWVWTLMNHNYFKIIKDYDMRGLELILVSLLFNQKAAQRFTKYFSLKRKKFRK